MKTLYLMVFMTGCFLVNEASAKRQADPTDVVQVTCIFLDESRPDWTETAATEHGWDTLTQNCEAQGGIAIPEFVGGL